MFRKLPILLLIATLLCCARTSAQQTMMQEVSPAYLQRLIDTAIKYYPRVQTQRHHVEIAENDVKKARAGWFDAFNFSYLYSPNNSTTLVNPNLLNGYQVGMLLNVGSLLQKPYIVKHAKGDLEVVKAEYDEYIINLTALVKERYYLYIQSKQLLKVKMQAALDVETTVQQIKYKYEKGEESLENLNKNMFSYDNTLQAKIEAEASMLIAKARLEELVGITLEQIQ